MNQNTPTAFSNPQAATNMTMIARVEGNPLCMADATIRVFVGDELAAVAEPIMVDDEPLYFLTIQSDRVGELRFEIDGQQLTTNDQRPIRYAADAHHGTLKAPVVLEPTSETGAYKIIENDHIVIIRNNEKYDVTGKKL